MNPTGELDRIYQLFRLSGPVGWIIIIEKSWIEKALFHLRKNAIFFCLRLETAFLNSGFPTAEVVASVRANLKEPTNDNRASFRQFLDVICLAVPCHALPHPAACYVLVNRSRVGVTKTSAQELECLRVSPD